MSEEDVIRRAVAESLRRHLKSPNARPIIDEDVINAVPEGGSFTLPDNALVTPLAQTMAMTRRIKLVPASEIVTVPAEGQVVAIGADHGGFPMKEMIKTDLQSRYTVIDCGNRQHCQRRLPRFCTGCRPVGQHWTGVARHHDRWGRHRFLYGGK